MPVAEKRFYPPWLNQSPACDVVALLGAESVRFVGGAVRESLLGLPTRDIDAATTHLPGEVMRLAKMSGISAVPTGFQHGTVTLVFPSGAVEVTTLRRDVTTDGRRASVAFTDDWAEDAKRRDFTVNAIYLSASGALYDPEGGLSDLENGRLRFIGDTEARIKEDYLRILRYFRFSAHPQFAAGIEAGFVHIGADMMVIEREAVNLKKVSKERLWSEFFAWFQREDIIPSLELAAKAGVLAVVFDTPPCWQNAERPALRALRAYEFLCRALGNVPAPFMRLLCLLIAENKGASYLADRLQDWPLSRNERRTVKELERALAGSMLTSPQETAPLLYWQSAEVADMVAAFSLIDVDLAAGAITSVKAGCTSLFEHFKTVRQGWVRPDFPLAAKDLTAIGLHGPALGKALRACETQWVISGFALTRDHLVKNAIHLKTLNEN